MEIVRLVFPAGAEESFPAARMIGVRGQSLVILNDAITLDGEVLAQDHADEWESTDRALNGARILVGWSSPPTPDSSDFQVPTHTLAVIPVPRNAQSVWLAANFVEERGFWTGWEDGVEVGVGWGPAVSFPTIVAVPPRPVRLEVVEPKPFMVLPDYHHRVWSGLVPQALLDQDRRNSVGGPQVRPRTVPSIADTVTRATAINTLFSMTGPRNALASQPIADAPTLRTVHRIIVSVSAPTLVVIGGNNLTVGSPGTNEIARLRFPAAGIQVIEFDGAQLQVLDGAIGSDWKAYTSAAVTFDATILAG